MGLHVRRYYWADNENLVFNVTKWGQYSYGLYSVHREGKPLRTLIEIESFASILDLQDDVPNEILIQIGRNVYRQNYLKDIRQKGPMSPSSVTYRLKEENRGRVDAWMCDPEGFLRLGVGYKDRLFDEGNEKYIYRENEDLPWQKFPIAPDLDPVSFEYGSNYLYVATSRNRNTLALYNYDLENQYLGELIFSDRDYDVISGKFFYYHIPASLFFSKKKKRLVGIHYTRDKLTTHWIDPFYKQLQLGIDQALPNTLNQIIDVDWEETRFLILAKSDRDPGSYYLYDLNTGNFQRIFKTKPWIDPGKMASMQSISYIARDGLKIHGYLTLPLDKNDGPLRMIVMPHGGPFVRYEWGFNAEVQFLASRGYAVLQINYRGSTGYGRYYRETARGQFGKKVQDDITDGVYWAINEKIADPERIAIFGGSFGGYMALCGLTFTPDL